jgi:hypothetical protein
MKITIEVPDEIAGTDGTASELSREILEAFVVAKYRLGKISRKELSDSLGLDYWQTDELLSRWSGMRPYTLHDLVVDRESLAGLQ